LEAIWGPSNLRKIGGHLAARNGQKGQILVASNCQQGDFFGQEMTKKAKKQFPAARNYQKGNFLQQEMANKAKRQFLAARNFLFRHFLLQEFTFLPFWPFPGTRNGNKSISHPKKLIYSHYLDQEMGKKAKRPTSDPNRSKILNFFL